MQGRLGDVDQPCAQEEEGMGSEKSLRQPLPHVPLPDDARSDGSYGVLSPAGRLGESRDPGERGPDSPAA